MRADLIRKTRVGRLLHVTLPDGKFLVEYKGFGVGESIFVDGKRVVKKTGLVRMIPQFDFPLGTHRAVVRIQIKLWRDLLGLLFGRLKAFSFAVDDQILYKDES